AQDKPFFAGPRIEAIGNGYSGNDLASKVGSSITSYMPLGRDKEAMTLPNTSIETIRGSRELVATLTIENAARPLASRKDFADLARSLE
ncbi:hypothetical protein ABTK14_21590, partial [Acinetobacter baumannii]